MTGFLVCVSAAVPARIRRPACWLLVGLLAGLPLLAQAAVTVTGADGRTLTLNAPATRIVSLAPDLTELTFDVGAGSALVGASRYSDHPAAAKKLPRIGDAFQFDTERIVALQPELVLAWQTGTPDAVIQRLRALKLPVLVIGAHRLSDIAANLQLLGEVTGHATQARAAAVRFLEGLQQLRDHYAADRPVRVFYEISATPFYTVGGTQLVSRAIAVCGGRNIFAELKAPAAVVNLGSILERDPQAIVTGEAPGAAARLQEWRRWPDVSAVRHGNLFAVGEALVSATPRLLDATAELCRDLDQARSLAAGGARKPQ